MNQEGRILKKIISGAVLSAMIFTYAIPTFAYTKEETVYTKLDSSGDSYKTIVSTHLKNDEKSKVLEDMSNLLNIENTKGDEKFSQNGKKIVWSANGDDIYYEGESKENLPIDVQISYELNGKKISSNDIVGKKGNVKINIDFENKEAHTVFINGEKEIMYTPFVVMCGTYIDGENTKNVEISSGKVVDDGSKYIVCGIALPGLKDSLKIDDIEIPSDLEITMNTEKFEMNNILIYATPKLFEEADLDIFDKLDDLYGKVDQIVSASEKIADGAETLKKGAKTYAEKSKEFTQALKKVSKGMNKANVNYSLINDSIKVLNSKSTDLKSGAKAVSDGTEAVKGGIDQITSGIKAAEEGLGSAETGISQLESGVKSILDNLDGIDTSDNSDKISDLNNLKRANSAASSSLEEMNRKLQSQISKLDEEEDSELIELLTEQIRANKVAQGTFDTDNTSLDSVINLLAATDTSSFESLVKGLTNIENGLANLKNSLTNIRNTDSLMYGLKTLEVGNSKLSDSTGELAKGAKALSDGTDALKSGTEQLEDGSSKMKDGLNILDVSTNKLAEASEKLTDGAKNIEKGADKLSSGINEFNREAIGKIANYIEGDLKDLRARAEKLKDLSEEYKTYTLLNEDGKNDGKAEFIMIVDSQKDEETGEEK